MSSRYSPTHHGTGHSETDHARRAEHARYVVLLKGASNIFMALGIMFLPIAVYDGPIPAFVSKMTGLQFIYRDADPGGTFALAALIMAAGVAALSAGMSHYEDAYKVIATMNAAFAYIGLLACIFSPKKFGSSVLLLGALQDVVWFLMIINAGGYTMSETFGMQHAYERMKRKRDELRHEQERRDREHQIRGEKDYVEKEGYGATGSTNTTSTGGGGGERHSGQHYQQQQPHSTMSASSGGGFGGSGFGTGVQHHGGTGSGGQQHQQQRYGAVPSGIEGEFGSHGLKTEKVRGFEHQ
ncbi:hypothetical protein NP233_g2909 [Leucocoprinus birnbaumii]|uniref:Uncharacterized protein n=1 Tax=Leucocoprinus birnbaumii TaxID=56174 RepID=A0AAD5YUE9_9AGAR|nr:hypothetical protein NP233_g2909 [Leucocoprinus birnbaumii]